MYRISLAAIILAVALTPPVFATHRAEIVPTFIGDVGTHAISADGRHMVFRQRRVAPGGETERVLVLWSQEEGVRDLATHPSLLALSAQISADGSTVAAIIREDITNSGARFDEVYRWHRDSGWQRITFSPDVASSPSSTIAMSDDGRRIAFAASIDPLGLNPDVEKQIFLWEEGQPLRQITPDSTCGDFGENFVDDISGDGQRIAYTSRCRFGSFNQDLGAELMLWVEGGGIRALTDGPEGVSAGIQLDYEGKTAAVNAFHLEENLPEFASSPTSEARHLWRWVDGHGFERLTKHPTLFGAPTISSDGTRIAFAADNGQGSEHNPEGGEEIFFWQLGEIAVITDSAQTDTNRGSDRPKISGDGTRIVFTASAGFDTPHDERTGRFLVDVLGARPGHANLLTNGGFDGNLDGWTLGSGSSFDLEDARESAASGSARVVATGSRGNGLSQCVSVAPSTRHVLSAQVKGTGNDGTVIVQVDSFAAKGCSGAPLGSVQPFLSRRNDGLFVGRYGRFLTSPATRSIRVRLMAIDNGSGTPFEAAIDDVALRPDNLAPILP